MALNKAKRDGTISPELAQELARRIKAINKNNPQQAPGEKHLKPIFDLIKKLYPNEASDPRLLFDWKWPFISAFDTLDTLTPVGLKPEADIFSGIGLTDLHSALPSIPKPEMPSLTELPGINLLDSLMGAGNVKNNDISESTVLVVTIPDVKQSISNGFSSVSI